MELVEREELLAALHALLDDTRAGSGRIVFVGGEAGVGKTSLVRAFSADVPGGVRLLWGACDPLATPRPLGPFHDMASRQPSIAAALGRPGRHERHMALLDELALTTVMVVEDAHWADEATLDALRFLGRRVDTTRGLILVTYRDDELDQGHRLRAVLGDLATAPGYRRLDVPLLTLAGVAAVVGDMSVDAHRLHDITDGNPFFVTEALAVPDATVPATISDAVLSRAGRLSLAARGLLGVASLAPGGLEPALAATLVDRAEAALDECTDHGILLLEGARMTFRHELARLAVEGSIPAARRRRLHQQLLKQLEALPNADPARLVHHAEAAGDTGRVLRYAPQAAREASAHGAHREAAAHYGRAVAHAGDLPPKERAELLACWAEERLTFDDYEVVIRTQQDAIELYRGAGDSLGEGATLAALGRTMQTRNQLQESARILHQAVEVLERVAPGPDLAWAYALQAFGAAFAYRLAEAIDWGTTAIDLAERHGASKAVIKGLAAVGGAHARRGQVDEGAAVLERSRRLAVEVGDDLQASGCLIRLAEVHTDARRYAQARALANEAISFSTARDIDLTERDARGLLARCLFEQGLWDEAGRLTDTLAPTQEARFGNVVPERLRVRTGRVRTHSLEQKLRTSLEADDPRLLWAVAASRAEAAWLAGRPEEIPSHVTDPYAEALRSGAVWATGELAFWLWRAGALKDPPEHAEDPYLLQIAGSWRQAAAAWEQIGCPYEQADALADGDEPAMREALAIFTRLGAQPAADRVRARMREAGVKHVPTRPRAATRAAPAGLTRRQLEILSLLGGGRTNADIARELFITEKTAEHHVSAVLRKLGVQNRGEAVAAARRIGVSDP